jgi:hypothetical protein
MQRAWWVGVDFGLVSKPLAGLGGVHGLLLLIGIDQRL